MTDYRQVSSLEEEEETFDGVPLVKQAQPNLRWSIVTSVVLIVLCSCLLLNGGVTVRVLVKDPGSIAPSLLNSAQNRPQLIETHHHHHENHNPNHEEHNHAPSASHQPRQPSEPATRTKQPQQAPQPLSTEQGPAGRARQAQSQTATSERQTKTAARGKESLLPPVNDGLASATPYPSPIDRGPKGRPVVFQGIEFWDGDLNHIAKPLPRDWPNDMKPEAQGRKAFVTMVTRESSGSMRYGCLVTALIASIKATKPNPNIEIVVAVLVEKRLKSFQGRALETITAVEVLGEPLYEMIREAGATRFILWPELDTTGMTTGGSWIQAFSKLQMFTLTDYERVLFMDSDVLILRNIDHLLDEAEFTAAPTWCCENYLSPSKPSGGFVVVQPSMQTWGLVQEYLKGIDPCGHKWRLGDMTLMWILFIDQAVLLSKSMKEWPTEDGQLFQEGRCYEGDAGYWPNRIDHAKGPSKRGRWKSLSDQYDLIVNVCGIEGFKRTGDRFNLTGAGKTGWGRLDAYSIHMTCGPKPNCIRDVDKEKDNPPCMVDIWDRWYNHLNKHFDKTKKYYPNVMNEEEYLKAKVKEQARLEAGRKRREEEERRLDEEERREEEAKAMMS